jgi:predicted transcriptional regulator
MIDRLMVYIPLSKQRDKLLERLGKIAKKKDRSVNYLVIEALRQFLEREEKNSG